MSAQRTDGAVSVSPEALGRPGAPADNVTVLEPSSSWPTLDSVKPAETAWRRVAEGFSA